MTKKHNQDHKLTVVYVKRGYRINSLRKRGISFSRKQLQLLEDLRLFPPRVSRFMWDADEVDEWLKQRDL